MNIYVSLINIEILIYFSEMGYVPTRNGRKREGKRDSTNKQTNIINMRCVKTQKTNIFTNHRKYDFKIDEKIRKYFTTII